MNYYESIHQNALRLARNYRRCEHELLSAIQQVDAKRVYLKFGYKNLFEYCTRCLLLSEGTTYAMIRVARKSLEVPEIQRELQNGTLTLSHAKTLVSVITPENKSNWIEKAKTLSVHALEREVVQLIPDMQIREVLKPVCENKLKLECAVSPELEKKIRRAQDLLSQKTAKAATLEQTLLVVFQEYLERQDPLQQPSKVSTWTKQKTVTPALRRAVLKRSAGECQAKTPQGTQCKETRWLDVHHLKPISQGGTHDFSNLTVLCKGHHRVAHT